MAPHSASSSLAAERLVVGQRVAGYHKQRAREYAARRQQMQRQKIELLRRNDMEGYMKLVKV